MPDPRTPAYVLRAMARLKLPAANDEAIPNPESVMNNATAYNLGLSDGLEIAALNADGIAEDRLRRQLEAGRLIGIAMMHGQVSAAMQMHALTLRKIQTEPSALRELVRAARGVLYHHERGQGAGYSKEMAAMRAAIAKMEQPE